MTSSSFCPRFIQRLEKPANHICLNDGMLGFNKEALDAIKSFMNFDYMGSSEFEFGALPKAFKEFFDLNKKGALEAKEVAIDVLPDDWDFRNGVVPPEKKTTFYILGKKSQIADITGFIEAEAVGVGPRLQEVTQLRRAAFTKEIEEKDGFTTRTCGWFDIYNHYFVFLDREMFENMLLATGVKLAAPQLPAPASPQLPAPANPSPA